MREQIFNHPFRFINHPESAVYPMRFFVELARVIEEPMPQDVNVRIPDHMIAPVRTIQNFPVSVGTVLLIGRIRIF